MIDSNPGREKMGRRTAVVLLMLVLVSIFAVISTRTVFASDEIDSGMCGNSVYWKLNQDGVLSIYGNGSMENYSASSRPPYYSHHSEINEVVIENGIYQIGDYAFYGFDTINSITIPSSVYDLGRQTFESCNSIQELHIESLESWFNAQKFNANSVPLFNSSESGIETKLFINEQEIKTIELPSTMNSIPAYAFAGFSGVNEIIIPEGVYSIGGYAFSHCTSITNIELPDTVRTVDNGAFSGCTGITEIDLPKGITLGGECIFEKCSNLQSINLPKSVTSIMRETFQECEKLQRVTIQGNITQIGVFAFDGCESLREIDIPNSVETINDGAFRGCKSLEHVVIPSNCEMPYGRHFQDCSALKTVHFNGPTSGIGRGSFDGCTSLESIVLPEGVTFIDSGAFSKCNNLKTVILPSTITRMSSDAFGYYDPDSYLPEITVGLIKGSPTESSIRSASYGRRKKIVYINTPEDTQEESLLLATNTLTLTVGDTYPLVDLALYTGDNSEEIDVSIDDKTIVMNDEGIVAALREGTCTATLSAGNCSENIQITVLSDAENQNEISFSSQAISVDRNCYSTNPVVFSSTMKSLQLKWQSADASIATVNNGVVYGVNPGTTTITATTNDNSISSSYTVTVKSPLQGILSFENIVNNTIVKGDASYVDYYLYPADTTDDLSVSFESSSPEIVSVDSSGKLSANEVGSATITISAGNIKKDINYQVVVPLKAISISPKICTLNCGRQLQLSVDYTPADTTDEKNVTWETNKTTVAEVDQNGLVTAKGYGIATITATVGEAQATCTVVCPDVTMTGIEMKDCSVEYGEIFDPPISFIPDDTTDDRTLILTSDNESVVAINKDNKLEAKGIGTATITGVVGEYTDSCEITVVKANPTIVVPNSLEASCNSPLSAIVLPEGFTWEEPSMSVGEAGAKKFKATFTPADSEHYETVANIEISVNVNHKYSEEWESDTDTHWHICSCGEKGNEAQHEFGEWIITEEPSDENEGVAVRRCEICGYEDSQESHSWYSDFTVEKEATCTEPGLKSIHCRHCEATKDEQILDALGHSYAEYVVAPTCSEAGHTLHVCGRCGDIYTDSETQAKGHTFSDWMIDTDSSCTSEGIQHRECTKCGYTETKGVNKKEHTFATEYTTDKDPTCMTDGSKSYHCTAEGCIATTGSTVIPATGHQYSKWVVTVAPTCTAAGVSEHECSVCHTKETLEVPATGHEWMTKTTVDIDPTCTEAGSKSIHCKACDAVKDGTVEAIPATGHSYESWETIKEPTCTEPGQKERICSICNDKQIEEIAANDHSWLNTHTIDKEATCTESGEKSIHCKVCDTVKDGTVEAIPATGHSYGSWETIKEPTCTEPGQKERICSICNDKQIEEISANDHSWLNTHTIDKEATCTESGEKSIHCKVCDAIKEDSKVITELLGHEYTEAVVEPTCSQKGYTLYVCGRCGDSYTDNETDAVGHKFGDWIIDTDSTCTSEGIRYRECSECGYIETKDINKKEHSFSSEYTIDKDATCTTDGSKSFHCTVDGCTATTGNEVIPATGHQYTKWKETKKPTCEDSGDAERSCTVCEITETVHFEARGHVWMNNPTVDKYPSCNEEGYESIHCAVCDAVKPGTKETISKVAHTWDSGKITTDPTCTKKGVKTLECTVCHKTKAEEISALGHKWNTTYTTDKAATQTTNGSKSIHCSICNEIKPSSSVVIPKTLQTDLPVVKIAKPVATKKAITIKWKKVSKANQKKIASIQIQYSFDKTFKTGVKTVTAKKTVASKKIKKLKSKKTYYVRVRAYRKSGGTVHVSKWSIVKKVKTK